MFKGSGCVEKTGVDAVEPSVVVVDDRVPELGGVIFGHFHDLVCVAVADEVSLGRHVSEQSRLSFKDG